MLGPLASLLILIGNAVTPGRGFREGPFATQVELRELVDLAEQRGVVEHGEREMIHSVFALGDTIAREVMVPRTEMVWIEANKSASQALTLALRSGFSRIPVIGENVDDVLGVVYLKDLVRRSQTGDRRDAEVGAVMRPATFVPESKPVDDLLREMQAARTHMAIVVDEYGGTAGLVTIEDILEEIVGEITDEYDVERPPVERLDDGRVRVTARLPVEDLGELFDVELPADEVETVAACWPRPWAGCRSRARTPTVGGLRLVAEGTTGRRNRIDTVLVSRAGRRAAEPEREPDRRCLNRPRWTPRTPSWSPWPGPPGPGSARSRGPRSATRTAGRTPPPPSPCRRWRCRRCSWRWPAPWRPARAAWRRRPWSPRRPLWTATGSCAVRDLAAAAPGPRRHPRRPRLRALVD